ncbi:MAG TPA: type I glyceraldehyde-3-phosphate dehydrogenase [Chloroflexi bacterium]|jgi:glyceraldehyde 3-phosphate dehydrogenase|nr:type I glyceraldehyde-3-phosphate dehydrogenase [Anaerolineaceae bacterium]HHX09003.1 type I glyceraldehyde-3-phosphate dehydrogenase [Chloroflexota bacterium]
MKTQVGINGFGRIGRLVLKAILERADDTLEVVAINDLVDVKQNAHLFKYDSTYGIFDGEVKVNDANNIVINGKEIKVFTERDPGNLPWGDLGVDIVVESTGIFTTAKSDPEKGKIGADAHILRGGAKKVIISAPAKGEDLTVVLGVNEEMYDSEKHHIISNASCTTNCLAPAAKVVNDLYKIKYGMMTTIHSYTNDQVILDTGHKKDIRRSRAAGLNIIPTTTGAAKAVALVIPDLKGKFDGYALRVPTPTVSIVDFVAEVENPVSLEALNAAFKEAAEGDLKGILGVSTGEYDQPLVSMDYKGDSRSSIVDLDKNMVMGDKLVKVVTWYDNEWGYSSRTADLAKFVAEKL